MKRQMLLKAAVLYLLVSGSSIALAVWLAAGNLSSVLPWLVVLCGALVFTALQAVMFSSGRRRNRSQLNAKQQLQLALDAAGECMWEWQLTDGATSIHFSDPYCAMLGYAPNEFPGDQASWQQLLHPDEREHVQHRITELFAEARDVTYENTYRMLHKDGDYRWIHSRGRLFTDQGRLVRFIGIAADISQERDNNERLRLANVVFDSTHEGVLISDADNKVVFVNPAFSDITGYAAEEVVGQTPRVLQSGRHNKEFYAEMWRSLDTRDSWTGEIWNRRKSGEVLPQLQTITQLRDEHGLITHRVAVFSDISLLKSSQNELSFLAHYDPLTSLPNRILLHEHLKLSLQRAIRHGKPAALLVIDIDHFKNVNESLGYASGDELIKQVIERIQQVADPQDVLCRFGGDEFALVADSCTDTVQTVQQVERIMGLFRQPFSVEQRDIFMTASIGICLYPTTGRSAEEIFRYAETALSKAKETGRGTYAFYDSALTRLAAEKLHTASELRIAVDEGQLELFYQPVYSLDSARVVGCEALARWRHPARGLLSPACFVPIAESNGVICEIDAWAMREACRQTQQWLEQGLELEFVSVNISTRVFDRSEFLKDSVRGSLQASGLPARCLELEITESSMMVNPEQSVGLLHELRNMGVRLAIDDFGTGYSSLGRLKYLPVDKLKIDRSFVQNLPHDPADIALVHSITSLSDSLDLLVQAEGVETEEQADFLRKYPHMLVQGYLYGKPVPADQFATHLQSRAI